MKKLIALIACFCLVTFVSKAQNLKTQEVKVSKKNISEDKADRTMNSLRGRLQLSNEQADKLLPFIKKTDLQRAELAKQMQMGNVSNTEFVKSMQAKVEKLKNTQIAFVKSVLTEKQAKLFDDINLAMLFN